MNKPFSTMQPARKLERSGNRILSLSEYGCPNGVPVLAFHGIPGTRLMFRPTHVVATRLGLRIIAPDRPGFGHSTPQAGRQLQDWLPEVEAILSAYNFNRFALIGVSGGCPFATATAAHFGERVVAMVLFGPMGPVAEMTASELSFFQRNFFLRLVKMPISLRIILTLLNKLFQLSPNLLYRFFVQYIRPCDRAIMRNPVLAAEVIHDVHESLLQGGEGMRSDLRIYSLPWHVKYAKITAPTILWQGLDDNIVPIAAALRLGELIPGCTVNQLPNAGHFWIYDHIEPVLMALRDMAERNNI